MFTILFLLSASTGLGYLLRRVKPVAKFGEAVQYTVFAMLFVFGIIVGSDSGLMSRLGEFSLQAIVIAVAGTAGSMLAVYLLYRFLSRKGGSK